MGTQEFPSEEAHQETLAQYNINPKRAMITLIISIFVDNQLKTSISVQGSDGQWIEETRSLGLIYGSNHYLRLYFGQTGLDIDTITIKFVEEFK